MNDYKELVEHPELCWDYIDRLRIAIEQLVKERDAAIADLKTATLTTYPCHFCGKVNNCKHDNMGIMCMGLPMNMSRREFEWRGVSE